MKVILVSFGSYGDISPFVWMAKKLRDEGHSIVFICNPFFMETINKEGFSFKPAGTLEDYKTATIPATVTGLSQEVSSFLTENEKPIVFTPGSAVRHIDQFFRAAAIALEKNRQARHFSD